jgi:outer membrane protein TolC
MALSRSLPPGKCCKLAGALALMGMVSLSASAAPAAPVPSVPPSATANSGPTRNSSPNNLNVSGTKAIAVPQNMVFSAQPVRTPYPAIGPVRPLSLRDAIELTLQKNPTIQLQQEEILGAKGQLRSAAGPFDPVIQAQFNRSFSRTPGVVLEPFLGINPNSPLFITRQDNTGVTVQAQQTFRNGISLSPLISVTRDITNRETPVGSTSLIGFSLNVPLLQGLGPNASAPATERAARVNVEISKLNLEFTITQEVFNTINAYWNCLLAQDTVRIAWSNEAAARQLVQITQALIDGFVQPAVQMAQAQGNLEQYVSQRMLAEQQQSQASQQLAVAIGLSAEEVKKELLVVGQFPRPNERSPLKAEDILPLVDLAAKERRDLMAARKTAEANAVLLLGAKNNTLPQLNAAFGAGFAGIQRGNTAANTVGSLNHNLTGVNMFGSVSLSLPVHNDAAEGALMQQKSQLLQAQTQIYLQSSQVASNVVTAAKSVINTKRALEQAEASAENQRKSVVAQEQLFALGLSSIVEVITTETNLASADLTVATNQAQYAIDVAQLRFATGTLLPVNASEIYHLDLAEILRLPRWKEKNAKNPVQKPPRRAQQ